ncbi:flagellar transcriptional regulator FlhD [Achromobacter kerstersii]
MPRSTELLRDIHETNLMYLLLLQRLARSGEAGAVAGVPLSPEACLWLAALQPEALVKLAQNSVLLAQLNLAPHLLLTALSQGIDTTLTARARTELPDGQSTPAASLGQI